MSSFQNCNLVTYYRLCPFPAPKDLCDTAGVRYVYFPQDMTFDMAKTTCSRLGNGWTMAMPRSPQQNQCVYSKRVEYERAGSRGNVWLGFFRRFTGQYQGIDNKGLWSTFWAPAHPKRADPRNCAMMWGTAPLIMQWGDAYCTAGGRNEKFPVMCQQSE